MPPAHIGRHEDHRASPHRARALPGRLRRRLQLELLGLDRVESGAFESGPIDTGKSAEVTLKKAGTFDYYCAFRPFMKGTITVE